jgi:TRAP-type mannitol/chloroaromatic compound transport system permease large subunit
MTAFIAQNMAPIMFFFLVIFLLLGYPVAFSLAALGMAFFVIGVELAPLSGGNITLSWSLLQAMPERIYGVMNNDTLLAIPFFTFMGLILERSGMAEDLLDTIGQLFGPIRGGVAYAVVFVGALLAATTGVVAASVISMGLISLPIMLRYGYDRRVASGVIAASGTLAQIIPPSLVLIVMADQLGKSVGDMYEGAFIPGIVLAALYAGYIFIVSMIKPSFVPALPKEARTLGSGVLGLGMLVALAVLIGVLLSKYYLPGRVAKGNENIIAASIGFLVSYIVAYAHKTMKLSLISRLSQETILVLMPPLGLIFLVLGTIFLGIATPTEGGAMGAAGAILIALAKGRLSWELTRQAVDSTAKLSAFVLFILIGARVFSLTFYGVNGHLWVEHLLVSLPGGATGFLIVVNVMVFLLAFFLDFFELAFIIIPLLGPPAEKLGIDLIWFGVILGVNMQTSFMHPPFGFALFYLRSVAPEREYVDKITGQKMAPVTTAQIYWGAIPYVVIQCIMVALVIIFPQMVMHYKNQGTQLNQQQVDDALKNLSIPGLGAPGGLPGLGAPGGLPGLPGLDPPPIIIPPPRN